MSNVVEAIETLGGVSPTSSRTKLKGFLLELLYNGDLELLFKDSVRLTEFGEDMFERKLDSYSDQELQDEMALRGIVDLRQAIRDIQWRRSIMMDVSQDVEELLNTDVE